MKRGLGRILLLLLAVALGLTAGGACMEWLWNPVPPRVDSRTLNGMVIHGWPDFYRFLPGSRTVAVSPTAEFAVRYEINRIGLRDRDITLRRKSDLRRIVFIGDSFTEGYGVEQDQVYPRVVEELFQGRVECVNAGMRAMSPSFACFRVMRLLTQGLEFDALVCQVYDNDPDDDLNHSRKFALGRDASTSRLMRGAFHEASSRFAWLDWIARHAARYHLGRSFMSSIHGRQAERPFTKRLPPSLAERVGDVCRARGITLLGYTRNAHDIEITFPMQSDLVLETPQLDALWLNMRQWMLEGGGFQPPAVSHDQLERTLGYLGSLRALLREARKDLLVIYQPGASLLLEAPIEKPLAAFCRRESIPYLSLRQPLLEACSNSSSAFYFPLDGHLTATGHRAVGEFLYPWLERGIQR